ncbi:hypothetical protein D1631_07380 [Chryseobacterium nematophagum]|uniref:DUF7683 domain-containing protein n=1 Tax=Chryseobacterium nematophagum TaxID=2305228 RepID=A0A3M7TE22_9FLAO|nr:hypothetical protein [Chryseobacterium nematophagum]RNA61765.1 hypothetical protein D1631_07380 [Chryseobacterium nematophagum]
MKLVRSIEEYRKSDKALNKGYILNITPKEILKILDDLKLYEDDYKDEIYDQYDLTEQQIQKLKPFLKENLNEDFNIYLYQLTCHNEQLVEKKTIKYFAEFISLNEFDKETGDIQNHYELTVPPNKIFPYIEDIILDDDDTLEDYELYELTEIQIQKLKPFVKNNFLNENINKFKYYLQHVRKPIYED